MNALLVKSNLTQADYFKDIVATIREPLLVLGADLRVLAANRSFYKTFKVKPKDTIGIEVYDLGNRQWDIPGLRVLLETILPEKAVFNDYEVEHDFPSIGKRTLLLNARRLPAPPMEARWILLAFEDVSGRRQSERSLQASEVRFREAFENATDNMLLVEKNNGRVLNSNRAAQQTFGYSNQKLLKMNLWELGILEDRQQFEQVAEELEIKGALQILDKTINNRRGRAIPATIYFTDRTAVIQCNIRDITARKQTEETIRDLARFPAENPNPVMRIARGGELLYANEGALVQLAGWKLKPGKPAPKVLNDLIREVFATGATKTVETTCGESVFTLSIQPTPEQKDVNVYGSDITERKRAEDALLDSEEKYRSIFENIHDAYYETSFDGTILEVSPSIAHITKGQYHREDFIGRSIYAFLADSKYRDALIAALQKTGHVTDFEAIVKNRDNSLMPFSISAKIQFDTQGKPEKIIGSMHDISLRKRAQEEILQLNASLEERVAERTRELRETREQLERKERLAMLGALAGGVGHELRNPLGSISNSIYYLKLIQPDATEKIKKHHALIEQEVCNAAHIVSDLLDYARVISTKPRAGSVADLVQHTLSRFPVPASIQVSLKIPAGLPQVYADPLHIEQVLGNLIINACQAMTSPSENQPAGAASASGRGKLTIAAWLVGQVSGKRPESSTVSDRQKPMLAISLKDTGSGIIPENMDKLFEALFTTKAKGIGLGLAVSQKLAEANGGSIAVKSQAGKGSTFTLYLPILGSEKIRDVVELD
jgi:PAS domain S-box-containing protein